MGGMDKTGRQNTERNRRRKRSPHKPSKYLGSQTEF